MVSYNPFFIRHVKAYINVEVYISVEAIKYIQKYIYKSFDCTIIKENMEKDEVAQYF